MPQVRKEHPKINLFEAFVTRSYSSKGSFIFNEGRHIFVPTKNFFRKLFLLHKFFENFSYQRPPPPLNIPEYIYINVLKEREKGFLQKYSILNIFFQISYGLGKIPYGRGLVYIPLIWNCFRSLE